MCGCAHIKLPIKAKIKKKIKLNKAKSLESSPLSVIPLRFWSQTKNIFPWILGIFSDSFFLFSFISVWLQRISMDRWLKWKEELLLLYLIRLGLLNSLGTLGNFNFLFFLFFSLFHLVKTVKSMFFFAGLLFTKDFYQVRNATIWLLW